MILAQNKIFLKRVDDWTIYQNFLDTGFQLDAKDSSGQLKQLIEDVQKKDENKRGPFLILMEYYDRLGGIFFINWFSFI